jgi:hypothetical protein
VREYTDIGRPGKVIRLYLLWHGSPNIDPVIVTCPDGDEGRTQDEAEKPAKAEGGRHGDGGHRRNYLLVPTTI